MASNQELFADARELRETLAKLHPALFDTEAPVPFKVGLRDNICARYRDADPLVVATMFRWLTSRKLYLAAIKPGTARVGLDGPDGEVTASEAAFAAARLERRIAIDEIKAASRRKASAA